MKLKALATALFVSLLGVPAMATELGTFDDHKNLYNTIQSLGIRITINDPRHCSSGIDGAYNSGQRLLVVCQDNAVSRREVDWTANDLDTLRHEAHHIVQDCTLGSLGDNRLAPLFGDKESTMEFIRQSIGETRARQLMNNPAYRGRNSTHLTEMEAFATASFIDANTIARKLTEVCVR